MKTTRKPLLGAALCAIVFAGGCATANPEIDALRAIAEQAQADAAAANQAAAEARTIAQDAQRQSRDTDERLNRMFRRTLQK